MPNHITNRIKVTGPMDTVKEIVELCLDRDGEAIWTYNGEKMHNPFDFRKIVPETEDVKKSLEDPKYYPEEYMKNWKPEFPFQTHPMEYWYEWHCQYWGTKWNSYDPSVDEDGSDGKWVVWFDTAWAAPHPVIEALAAKFPDVYIDHRWADEDIGSNAGIRKYKAGKVYFGESMDGHDRWCERVKNRSIGND